MTDLPKDVKDFIEKYKSIKLTNRRSFYLLSKEAIDLAKEHQDFKTAIAHVIVDKGTALGELKRGAISKIIMYAMDLEIQDKNIDDKLTPAEKWLTMEAITNNGLNGTKHDQLVETFIIHTHGIANFKDFLLFCKQGIDLYKKFPHSRTSIAYRIAEESLSPPDDTEAKKIRREITDLAVDLEVPDSAVYMGDGLSVKKKWQLLEYIITEELNKLS